MSTQEIIKRLCDKKGISVSALEQELGFSNASLKGNGAIKSDRLFEVAKYFKVSMEYLMTGHDPEVPEIDYDTFEVIEMFSKFSKEQKQAFINLMHAFAPTI